MIVSSRADFIMKLHVMSHGGRPSILYSVHSSEGRHIPLVLLPHPTPNHLILHIASPTEESLVICNIIHRVVLLECINWPFYVTSHYNTVTPLRGVHLPNISMGVRCLTTMRNFAHVHDYGNIEKLQSNWRHTVRDAVTAPCIRLRKTTPHPDSHVYNYA